MQMDASRCEVTVASKPCEAHGRVLDGTDVPLRSKFGDVVVSV